MKWILALFLSAGVFYLEAFAALKLWGWFMPTWVQLTLTQWFAVNGILSCFCRQMQRVADTRPPLDILKEFGMFLLSPVFLLLIGYVIHKFQ